MPGRIQIRWLDGDRVQAHCYDCPDWNPPIHEGGIAAWPLASKDCEPHMIERHLEQAERAAEVNMSAEDYKAWLESLPVDTKTP